MLSRFGATGPLVPNLVIRVTCSSQAEPPTPHGSRRGAQKKRHALNSKPDSLICLALAPSQEPKCGVKFPNVRAAGEHCRKSRTV